MPTDHSSGAAPSMRERISETIRLRGLRCENCGELADVYAQDEECEGYHFCNACYDALEVDDVDF